MIHKKHILLLLALAFALTVFSGCAKSNKAENTSPNNPGVSDESPPLAVDRTPGHEATTNDNNGEIDDYTGLLPIGSVVLLENSTKRVMIIGVCQMQTNVEGEIIWDYAGCMYPEGYMGGDKTYLFNGDQIEQVFSLGYQDEEQRAFKSEAEAVLERLRGE